MHFGVGKKKKKKKIQPNKNSINTKVFNYCVARNKLILSKRVILVYKIYTTVLT